MLRPSRIHMRITAIDGREISRVQVGGRAIKAGDGNLVTT